MHFSLPKVIVYRMSKKGFTKIVNSMTGGAGVFVIGHDHIGHLYI